MLITQKVFSHLLVAALAIGSVACPCPAEGNSEAGSHAHHQTQTHAPATAESCQHLECVTNCSRISANPQQDANSPCKGKLQLDDSDAIEPETIAWLHRTRSAAWTNPPPHYLSLSHDTPVRRFDRLLD